MKYLLILFASLIISQDIIKDARDQERYTSKVIEKKIWIKENLRFQQYSQGKIIPDYSKYGAYYTKSELEGVCPDGFHVPTLEEWKAYILQLPGKANNRQGILLPITSLSEYGLHLGGMGREDTVFLSHTMGYYWTSSDTLKPYFKQPEAGNQRHLVGIHIWSSGEQDSINVEPTYMLAESYEPWIRMNCKCLKNE